MVMITTIQLKQTTKQRLSTIQTKEKLHNYDEVIQHLLTKHKDVQDMFGYNKRKPIKFTREDEMKFHEL